MGASLFTTIYYADIYLLPVTVTAAFILQPSASYSLSQSDPASRRPDGVQIQTDLPRFHSRNPDIFSDRGSGLPLLQTGVYGQIFQILLNP